MLIGTRRALLKRKGQNAAIPTVGLQLWLDAALGTFTDAAMTTPAVNDGDRIGGWQDQSVNGFHATQGTAGKQPTLKLNLYNGKPAIRFASATSQDLTFGNPAGFVVGDTLTMFFVISNSTASAQYLFGQNRVAGSMLFRINPSTGVHDALIAGTTVASLAESSLDVQANKVLFYRRNGGATNVMGVGTERHAGGNATTSFSANSTKYIGSGGPNAGYFSNGDILEVIFYDRALDDDELLQVAAYLCDKYNFRREIAESIEHDWSFVQVRDTQYWDYPDQYNATMQWVADRAEAYNIKFAMSVGDLTMDDANWDVRVTAWNLLNGSGILQGACRGNHDSAVQFRINMPVSRFSHADAIRVEGASEELSFPFTVGATTYRVVTLDFGPTQAAIDWALALCDAHPTDKFLFFTHGYMTNGDALFVSGDGDCPPNHSGQEQWDELYKLRSNIIYVGCGHEPSAEGDRQDVGVGGNQVTQILTGHRYGYHATLIMVDLVNGKLNVINRSSNSVSSNVATGDLQNRYQLDIAGWS